MGGPAGVTEITGAQLRDSKKRSGPTLLTERDSERLEVIGERNSESDGDVNMELRNEALVPSLLTPPDTRDQAEATANSHFLCSPTTSTSVRKLEHLCSAKLSYNAAANLGVRRGRSRTAIDCESSSASATPANSPVKLSRKRVVDSDFSPSPRRLCSEIAQSHMSSRVKRKLLSDMARMSVDSDVESNDVDTSHERSAKRRSGVTFDDRLSTERKSEIRSHNGRGAWFSSFERK